MIVIFVYSKFRNLVPFQLLIINQSQIKILLPLNFWYTKSRKYRRLTKPSVFGREQLHCDVHFLADYRISKAEGEIDPPRDRLPDLLFEPTTRDSQLWLLRVVGQGVGFAYSEASIQVFYKFWPIVTVATRVVWLDPKPGVAGVVYLS